MKRQSETKFLEEDALHFDGGGEGSGPHRKPHVAKKRRVNKDLEIVFDPQAHKEYLTGFHKRKVQRRKEAERNQAEKLRKQRIEDRAQKKAQLRKELDLDRYDTPPPSDTEGKGRDVRVYADDAFTTTVTVAAVALHSDSEAEEEAEEQGCASGPVTNMESQGQGRLIQNDSKVTAKAALTPGKPRLKPKKVKAKKQGKYSKGAKKAGKKKKKGKGR